MARTIAKPSLCCAVALAAWMSSVAAVRAQGPEDQRIARTGVTADVRMGACSARIASQSEPPTRRAEAFAHRGNAHYQKSEWDQAIADLDEAIALAPDTASFHAFRGRAYRAKRDFARAMADFNEAIRLDPKLVVAFGGRGLVHYAKGEYHSAVADFDEAIRLDPKQAQALAYRGTIYEEQNDLDRAIADYSVAIELRPSAGLFLARGRVLQRKKMFGHAIADLNEATRLDPKLVAAYTNRAAIYADLDDFTHVIAEYSVAIELAPSARLFDLRGGAYLLQADFGHALADYDEAIRREPTAERFFARGFIHTKRREFKLSVADYDAVIALEPWWLSPRLARALDKWRSKD